MTLHRNAMHSPTITEIDAQHDELARRAGELLDGIRSGSGGLGRLIDFLHEYAVAHFGAEEDLMRESRFPGYVRHHAEHDRFAEDLVALASEYERSGTAALQALHAERWLTEWLEKHVRGTDAEFSRYFSGLQARAG
jgi:hemerythrin